jgi:hypothetical protein
MTTSVADQWRAALADVVVRHPDRRSKPVLRVVDGDPPVLYVGLDVAHCTADDAKEMRDFAIANVHLHCFPGIALARAWLAAAWVGYLQHEALELVTVGGLTDKVLDPHADPYPTNPLNRGLRDGFPNHLRPFDIYRTLCLVTDKKTASKMTWNGALGW